MKKLFLILLLIPLVSFGQKSNDADALKLCVALQSSNFTTDADAEDAVNKILSVIGASQKPILQACNNINNAIAAVYKGKRYILYDRDFMNSISEGTNKYWSNMFILAHEIGHHINGHSLDIALYAFEIIDPISLEEKRNQELEADEFAGFILEKLGASLNQTSELLSNLPKINNESYSTHPSKEKRIEAVRLGFNKSKKTTNAIDLLKKNLIIIENQSQNTLKNPVSNKTKFKKKSSKKDLTPNILNPRKMEIIGGSHLLTLKSSSDLNVSIDESYFSWGKIIDYNYENIVSKNIDPFKDFSNLPIKTINSVIKGENISEQSKNNFAILEIAQSHYKNKSDDQFIRKKKYELKLEPMFLDGYMSENRSWWEKNLKEIENFYADIELKIDENEIISLRGKIKSEDNQYRIAKIEISSSYRSLPGDWLKNRAEDLPMNTQREIEEFEESYERDRRVLEADLMLQKTFSYLINELKTSKILFIRIKKIIPTNRDFSSSLSRTIDNKIYKFNLKGSSKALQF
jgi:hypothetical protein